MTWALHVYRNHKSNTFGVYVQPGKDGTAQELIEGGFFTRMAANHARNRWERELLQDEVEKAERKAGWDPNP